MKVCVSCGAQIEDNMKFCGSCGTPVADAAEAAQAAVGAENPQAGGAIPQQTNAIPTPTNTADAGQNYGQTQQFGTAQNYGQAQQYGAAQGYDPNQQPQQYQQQYNNFQQQGGAVAKKPNPLVEKVKKNPMLAAIPAAGIVVLIILIVVIANVTKYQKIDAQELFNFKFDGLNQYGIASAELNAYDSWDYSLSDTELLLKENLKELSIDSDWEDYDLGDGRKVSPYLSIEPETLKKTWTKAKSTKEMVSMRQALLKTNSKGNYLIKAKLDKEKDLKNGDKIKVTVEYDADLLKENKIKLTNTSFEIEVKNLEEGIDFDPFDEKYLKVTFDGMDGEGSMTVESTSERPSGVFYDYDWYGGLSNGDKVTVTAEVYLTEAGSAFYFESDGKYYIVKNKDDLKKEFEVSGLKELEEIDVFENIAFTYDRGTPFLRVRDIDNDNMDKLIVDNVSFYLENADSLKVGDKFTVKAYSYSLKSEGYKIKGEVDSDGYVTKEFTVDDTMPAYVTADNGAVAYVSEDFSDIISDHETDIKTKLQGTSASWLWDSTNVSYKGKVDRVDSMVLKDVYVGFTSKNNYSNVSGYVSRVYGLYEIKVTTTDEEESSATLYAVIYLENVISGNDGFYQSSGWDSSGIHYYGAMADFNKEVVGKEGYTVTKCGGSSTGSDDSKAETTTTTTTTTKAEETTTTTTAKEDGEDKEESTTTTTTTAKADDAAAEESSAE